MHTAHAETEPGVVHPQEDQKSVPYMIADKLKKVGPLFLFTVIIPTLLAIIYYGFIASDVYISESRFTVRSPEKSTPSGLGALFKSSGFANAGDEVYAAQDYVLSRDALAALNRKNAFLRAYSAPSISVFDRFPGLGGADTFEDLYKYYKKKVDVKYETSSSIVTLTMRAYTPQDARRFNEQLLEMAEATVNKLNERGRQDLIRFAQREVDEARAFSQKSAVALSSYRNAVGIVDPEKQATVQIQMISKLQDELIATRTQLTETRTVSPQNPQIEVLAARAQSLNDEINKQLGLVAGSSKSLSSRAAQYQRVLLDNQFAEKQLAGAMAALNDARNEANRKQAYVERIVQPNMPDEPLEPRRLRGILSTLILGLAAWGIISMLVAGMLEHRD
ncbi:WcbD protein [Sphingobium quisquiliarum P25]|uniref:WcbD protein n=2 Tax=Sphingobium quisquiliarum TaxID=538379 RepID=T0GIT9_9SPHN|nr:WcbD protein [Sphingobium quisquiliarum P25]